ncbi:LysM peptidoglycan-binding domain-containing protein [Microbacterium sp. YY-03]|uniref:LysM peptidoglycan-binding domain-containing protein n=1 Tax=Microbacterium sp. YY-03 TaxID=3421636 RepID=UPI003D17F65E
MSTISIQATARPARVVLTPRVGAAAGGSAVTTRLRITDRGRRVLATLVALPVVIAAAVAVLSGGSALASLYEGTPATFETINVMPGDSLWSIAGKVAPQADPRDVIDGIISLNALPSSAIEPGQTLAIPAEFTE